MVLPQQIRKAQRLSSWNSLLSRLGQHVYLISSIRFLRNSKHSTTWHIRVDYCFLSVHTHFVSNDRTVSARLDAWSISVLSVRTHHIHVVYRVRLQVHEQNPWWRGEKYKDTNAVMNNIVRSVFTKKYCFCNLTIMKIR